ncbi:hypothetical protein [Priestia megaterium]|uniref:hypothetical protein n=1 Tax=Priestia megaterium TaxID=1404 RepID=UPI001866A327|nr:hypothetical protein [Priestia megaterium]MBE2973409.1 hypothetical protein [Priestia megaterium]
MNKRHFVDLYGAAVDYVHKQTNQPELIGYVSFITNFGVVIGKVIPESNIDSTTLESLEKDLANAMEKGIDAASTAIALYKNHKGDNQAIALEDVTIKIAGDTIKSNNFVLFTDQVVGLLPGLQLY